MKMKVTFFAQRWVTWIHYRQISKEEIERSERKRILSGLFECSSTLRFTRVFRLQMLLSL